MSMLTCRPHDWLIEVNTINDLIKISDGITPSSGQDGGHTLEIKTNEARPDQDQNLKNLEHRIDDSS